MHPRIKILVAIIHIPGKDDDNFEHLKCMLNKFDIYIPTSGFYGDRWKLIKRHFIEKGYDSLFLICSDVSIVYGNIVNKIEEYANSLSVGCYGFGTIHNFTFGWLGYNNIEKEKPVPFIEGYCFGVNKALIEVLEHNNKYGYGVDVEIGYKSHSNGLKCILSNDVCISHSYGKSYSDNEATKEYCTFLSNNPSIHNYLKRLNIYTPI